MPGKHSINVDLAKVFETASARKLLTTLTWGDFVEVTGDPAGGKIPVRTFRYAEHSDGSILPEAVDAFIKIPRGMKAGNVVISSKGLQGVEGEL